MYLPADRRCRGRRLGPAFRRRIRSQPWPGVDGLRPRPEAGRGAKHRFVMARSEGAADPEIVRKLPPAHKIICYPAVEKVLLFARWLAHSLVVGEGLNTDQDTSVMPPMVRVATESEPGRVAGAIAGIIRDYGFAEAQAVGSAAINQMLKAT